MKIFAALGVIVAVGIVAFLFAMLYNQQETIDTLRDDRTYTLTQVQLLQRLTDDIVYSPAAEPGRVVLPTVFMDHIKQMCQGTAEACDRANFTQPRGIGMVRFEYEEGGCPSFNIPPGMMADYSVDPLINLGRTASVIQGPNSLATCNADFYSVLTFVCTRPGILC